MRANPGHNGLFERHGYGAPPRTGACRYMVLEDGRARECGAATREQYCRAHRAAVMPAGGQHWRVDRIA